MVKAPPPVVFRFFCHLDHLRFVCTQRRQEWSPKTGCIQVLGSSHEVRLRQGRHEIRLRFKTVRLESDELLEDEFVSWPLRGAKRTLRFETMGSGTQVTETNVWTPPRFARTAVKNRTDEQQELFDRKLENGKVLIEAVYAARGEQAFSTGIIEDAQALSIDPVVPIEPV